MNFRSVRFRITAWYSLSLCLATAFIFTSFYVVTQQTLYRQVDRELISHGDKLVQLATSEGSNIHEALLKHTVFTEFSQIPGMLVVVLDSNGKILQSSLPDDSPKNYSSQFQKARESSEPVFQNQSISSIPMRFYSKAVRENNEPVGIILVAHPIDVIQRSLNSLLTILGIVFILLVLPMVLGGYGMARGIMQPIAELIEKLRSSSSEKLNERVKNPKTGDEMEELVVTFNNLLDRLQEAFSREKQFIADVAHELKTPIATLQGGIEVILSKDRKKEEYKEALEEALIDAKRQTTTLNNILDLAWSEAGVNGQEKIVNLSEIFEELEDVIMKLAKQKNIKVEKAMQRNILVAGKGAKDKLPRAILNILDNAIKYTPKGGNIKIKLTKEGETALIKISDTGIGISEKDLSHVFDRFYRGSNSDRASGSGLGLAIAQSIIKTHQGTISLKSVKEKGTTVTVTLPIIKTS